MTKKKEITKAEQRLIDKLVAHYISKQPVVKTMLESLSSALLNSRPLMEHVHSTKSRLKDPSHLEDKLKRKILSAKNKKEAFAISEDNLLAQINDLAGFRILHLHTEQIVSIDRELKAVFKEYKFSLLEPPAARTWDDESERFFKECGLDTVKSETMYTSVHYVIESNSSTKTTCEIQVRTLAEELWGEVDHTMNYPHECGILSCREQIKVLARATSTCSRLVDSIFRSYKDAKT